jgi:hypothetical protein
MSRSGRFLLAVMDAGGTVPPALSLGAELVQRGHHVRVLADPTIEPAAKSAGCAFSPWREAPHFTSVTEQTTLIAALEGGNPYRAFRSAKSYAGKTMTSRFARDVVSTVRESPVDAILADGLPGILIGAQASRRPTAALVAQTYVRPTPGLPLLGTGWSPGQSLLGKARDKIVPRAASWLLTPTLPRLNAVVERYELQRVRGFRPVQPGTRHDQPILRLHCTAPSAECALRRAAARRSRLGSRCEMAAPRQ